MLKGEVNLAAEVLRRPYDHPLIRATRINLLDVQQRFQEMLGFNLRLPDARDPLTLEAQARTWAHMAKAHMYLHEYTRALGFLEDAQRAARACGMAHYLELCALLEEECRSSHAETGALETRERFLREFMAAAPSEESRLEAHMRLIRLVYRQGHYQKALRIALEVPRELHGQGFVELVLVLNKLDESDRLEQDHRPGATRALAGRQRHADARPGIHLGQSAADGLQPAPSPDGGMARGFRLGAAERGQFQRALEHFRSSFIHRSEWDLRLLRNMCLLELVFEAPELLAGHDLPALVEETRWLLDERLHPQAIAHRILPRATPYASTLMLGLSDVEIELRAAARQTLALVGFNGIEIRGVLHMEAQSMVRIVEETTDQEPRMNAGAVRSARLRLKLLLQGHDDPLIVRTSKVAAMLERLCQEADETERPRLRSRLEAYRQKHGL